MLKLLLAFIIAAASLAAMAVPNFPLGTYVYAGTVMNYRNEALTSADDVRIQAVSTNGTVLATATVVDAPSDSGVNFRLCASAVTNCVVVWSEAVAFTNSDDTSMVALVPQDYLDSILPLMEENEKSSYADISSTQMTIEQIDGTTKGGRDFMLADLCRAANVGYIESKQPVIAPENCHFIHALEERRDGCDHMHLNEDEA